MNEPMKLPILLCAEKL